MEEMTVTVVGIRVRQRRVSGFQKLRRGSRFCNKNGLWIHVVSELRNLYSFIMVVIKHQWSALFLTGNKTQCAYGRKSGSLSANHQGWEGEEILRGKIPRGDGGWGGMGKDERRNLREEKKKRR